MRRLDDIIATVVAMSAGFIMTFALLYDGIFAGTAADLMTATAMETALRTAVPVVTRIIQVTAALAIIIGLLNLLIVHLLSFARIRQYGLNAIWSLLLVICAVGVFVVALLESTGQLAPPPDAISYSSVLRDTVQYSVEASLGGLLAFSLVYGAFRFSRRRFDITGVIFLVTLIFNLLLQAGLKLPGLSSVTNTQQLVVGAGANGILLGIALATVVAGVRVLIGQDRSYRE